VTTYRQPETSPDMIHDNICLNENPSDSCFEKKIYVSDSYPSGRRQWDYCWKKRVSEITGRQKNIQSSIA